MSCGVIARQLKLQSIADTESSKGVCTHLERHRPLALSVPLCKDLVDKLVVDRLALDVLEQAVAHNLLVARPRRHVGEEPAKRVPVDPVLGPRLLLGRPSVILAEE